MIRGCVSNMTLAIKSELKISKEKIILCSNQKEEACNNIDLSVDTCIECDSNIDPTCRDQLKSDQYEKICSNGENGETGCYLWVRGNNESYKRGCLADLIAPFRSICTSQSNICKPCFGKNCNEKQTYQSCHICDKNDGFDCNQMRDNKFSKICSRYQSSCLVGIDEYGFIQRSCFHNESSEFQLKKFKYGFEICDENNCNNNDIHYSLKNRLHCYHCNGSVDYNCDFKEAASSFAFQHTRCEIYSPNQMCYAFINKGKMI